MKSSILWHILFCTMNIFSIVKAEEKASFVTNKIDNHTIKEDKLELLIEKFETYAEAQRKMWNIQSMAIAIVKDDKVLFSKGYGQRGLKDTRPVDENTLFQIGSLSKAFTSTLIALEIDKGKMKWEDKVIAHMSNFRMADPWVTAEFQILDLLSQRSGLPPYAGFSQAILGYSQEEMLQALRFLQPVSSFRSQYAYQNIFFVVAAHILETKSKINYAQLLKNEIFTPLEMTNSSASLEDYLSNENRVEWLVHLKDGTIHHLKDNFPEANWNYLLGPSGGINSSIKDMAKWLIFNANMGVFQNKQLVSKNNMQKLFRPTIYVGPSMLDSSLDIFYALGWVINQYSPYPIVWHNGSTLGVYNMAAFIPQEKLGIVILTNGRNTELATALTFQFFDMYFNKSEHDWSQMLLEKVKEKNQKNPEKITQPNPPQILTNYTGTYHNPIFGKVTVKEEETQLVVVFEKRKHSFSLKPWDRDIFSMEWPIVDLEAKEPTKVLFYSNNQGKIEKMIIDQLSDEGNGVFEKIMTP